MTNQRYEEDLDLLRYGRFLASYWIVLAAGAVIGALAGLAVAVALPDRFQSTAMLALTPPGGATTVLLTPASARAFFANLGVVSETLKETGLDRDGLTPQSFIDNAVDVLPVPETNLVKLQVTVSDPVKAQQAATVLATKVVELTRRVDRDSGVEAREMLEHQLSDATDARDKAEQELIDLQTRANVEGLAAEVERLQREHRPTATRRTELYRQQLAIEQLHVLYLERARVHADLVRRTDDARARPVESAQVHLVGTPSQPDRPLPRPRVPFALFGAILGTIAGVIASLAINKRRVDRSARI
jgi:uncharacterized protein involved in exopolysaccharide biosynthesis